jgi:hypothetical protein
MAAQILPFGLPTTPAATPIAFYARVGAAHRKHSELRAAGHFPARSLVVEASRLRPQGELASEARDAGCDLVLDTEFAELSAKAKFAGHARRAPWADGLLGPDSFQGDARIELMNTVARFAGANSFTTVLAPTHFLGDPDYSDWLALDAATCTELRKALNRVGGSDIQIDYPLILPNTMLNDASRRTAIINAITDLPFEKLWNRSSGFGSDAAPLAIKRYITSLQSLHALSKPIIADNLGGLVGGARSPLAQYPGQLMDSARPSALTLEAGISTRRRHLRMPISAGLFAPRSLASTALLPCPSLIFSSAPAEAGAYASAEIVHAAPTACLIWPPTQKAIWREKSSEPLHRSKMFRT